MAKYFKQANEIFIAPNGANEILDELPVAQYIVKQRPFTGFYLEETNQFTLPDRVFGDYLEKSERILKTYFARQCNTGVLLSGEKGSGKTLFARLLVNKAAKANIPTIIINECFENLTGFCQYITNIDTRCVILFDEFEKMFNKDSDQSFLLSLLDGVYQSNKLFVLTVNNIYAVNDYFINRPGRIYYHIKYSAIDDKVIKEYCDVYLNDKTYVEDIIALAKIVGSFNFDMLTAIVQECNIHNIAPKEAISMLNITFARDEVCYSFVLTQIATGKIKTGNIIASTTGVIFIDWDEEDEHISLRFDSNNLVGYDRQSGCFTYKTDKYSLEIRRTIRTELDLQWAF